MTMQSAGRLLIVAGVAVWVVFAAVWLAGGDCDAGRFVPFHLAGVVPGSIMTRWRRG
ncbi:MAG: hypothetical protein KJ698_13610 [Actinobacteria bacterium]|nr:hypothetical protein [Actinomycetota bacterium]MBU1495007.1 hypothetical protein [Actinomycetota bacterium]MBU1866034.1 hypothetical protein [Actinomycetota bacterium]